MRVPIGILKVRFGTWAYDKMAEILTGWEKEKSILFKVDVTEAKRYLGPFPVIKPAKPLTKKEIEELLKPKKKK